MVRREDHRTGIVCQEWNDPEMGLFINPEALKELVATIAQRVIEEEVVQHIGADRYQRTETRKGSRNGYKPRTMKTRVGKIEFKVPQVREGGFSSSVFERYQRSEKALLLSIQEMYIKGVSTRDMEDVMEMMGGFQISAGQVSRTMAELDEQIQQWRERPLTGHEYPVLVVDAIYENVRREGRVIKTAVLVVAGVTEVGHRDILGVWLGDSESEQTWSAAFSDLKSRGVGGMVLLISDAHKGIIKAMSRHFQGATWQRCQVHMMRDLLSMVSKKDRGDLAKDLQGIYHIEDKVLSLEAAKSVAEKWQKRYPRMIQSLLNGIEDTLTVLSFPREHWRRLRSTNMLERQNREFRRRTRKISIFPSESSCIRMYGALCMEQSEEWQSGDRIYLNMELWRT